MRITWVGTARQARRAEPTTSCCKSKDRRMWSGFYGGLTSTVPRLYELARFYKQQGVVTVAGGQHFVGDNIAEALHNGIDYVVFGEGEKTMRELLEVVEGRRELDGCPGIAYRANGDVVRTPDRAPLTDFDELPYPDFSLVRYARIKIYPVERIRGCCMNCEFCTVKSKPRCASVDRLLGNISHLVETRNAWQFFIVDDLFGQQRDETLRFCRQFADYQEQIGRRLETTVQIRLDKAKDPELLAAMRHAGIKYVAIGFESPIDEELKAMNKAISSRDMLSLVQVYHRFGFLIHGMFIFGYPLAEPGAFTMPARRAGATVPALHSPSQNRHRAGAAARPPARNRAAAPAGGTEPDLCPPGCGLGILRWEFPAL